MTVQYLQKVHIRFFFQMYGRYSRQLGEFARLEGLKAQEKRRLKEEKARKKELHGYQGKLFISSHNR